LQTIVKKWFQDKGYGFLENGTGPDIMVRKNELIKCSFLKVGSTVEFECHCDDRGLIAKKVSLSRKKNNTQNGASGFKKNPFGVMT
jgi:cold shock CspA family protein